MRDLLSMHTSSNLNKHQIKTYTISVETTNNLHLMYKLSNCIFEILGSNHK